MGRRILHTGDLGSASVLKVITNFLATANLVSCAEALTVAKGAGMDLGVAYEAIAISSGTSFVHETENQVILNGPVTYRLPWIWWPKTLDCSKRWRIAQMYRLK